MTFTKMGIGFGMTPFEPSSASTTYVDTTTEIIVQNQTNSDVNIIQYEEEDYIIQVEDD